MQGTVLFYSQQETKEEQADQTRLELTRSGRGLHTTHASRAPRRAAHHEPAATAGRAAHDLAARDLAARDLAARDLAAAPLADGLLQRHLHH